MTKDMGKVFSKFLVIAAVLAVACGMLAFYAMNAANPGPPSKPAAVTLPGNEFNASVGIPNAGLMLPYPKAGFYSLGANVTASHADRYGSVHVETTATYDAEKGSEYVTVDAAVSRARKAGDSLARVIASLPPQSYEAQYAKSGTVENLGGRDYFVFKQTEDVSVWTAYTLADRAVVGITMAYKPTAGAESAEADKHNGDLFRDMLTRISPK